MAIASLSTLAVTYFKGGNHLIGTGSAALVGKLNTIIAKVNELIANDGTSDTLSVGTVGGGDYYGTSNSWMSIDGTNPPTVSAIRFVDTNDGSYKTLVVTKGVTAVS